MQFWYTGKKEQQEILRELNEASMEYVPMSSADSSEWNIFARFHVNHVKFN